MPSAEDWLDNPSVFIDSLYDKYGENEDWEKTIIQACRKRIQEIPDMEKRIPLLNSSASHDVKSGQLVRFRCMVQDMHDPEYYVKRYVSRDLRSGKRKFKCGLLRDLTDCGPYEETEMEEQDSELSSRLSFHCISIPGENKWIKEEREKQEPSPSTSGQGKLGEKRSLDDDDDDENMESENDNHAGEEATKRSRTEQSSDRGSANTNQETWLNFPIPNMEGKAVIVKVYDKELKLNDVIEVVGVLSVDPKLNLLERNESMETDSPPVSLVPRLHAILIQKLTHTNVHLPERHVYDAWKHLCQENSVSALQCRQHLLNILKKLTFGDEIAAELLLCNLISRVYVRRDRTPVGSFSVNLFGVPVMTDYTEKVSQSLSKLLERSCKVDMSLQTMNNAKFIPKKNYDTNQLKSGYLQLPAGTLLLLDETKMSNGQLNQNGVQNLMALGNLIRWQNVEYDFQYHRLEFSTDLPVLVLSEGKSLLPCQVVIPVAPAYPIPAPDEHSNQIRETFGSLSSSLLMQLRCYLTVTRLMDYSLPDEMQKTIQEDFVEMRKEDPHFLADDLNLLLVLSKLLSVSQGDVVLTMSAWERAKAIEKERKRRLGSRSTS